MELDFSKIFDLQNAAIEGHTDGFCVDVVNTGQNAKTALEGSQSAQDKTEQAIDLLSAYKEQQEARERNRRIFAEYQDNTRRASTGRIDIIKGLQEGQDVCTLFLEAVDVIGSMTGDADFPRRVRAELEAVHGIGLGEERPRRMALEAIQYRLYRLTEAAARETDPGELQRINGAIKAHRAALDRLNATTGQQDRKTKKEQRKI